MANEDKDLSSIDSMPDPDAKPTTATQTDAVATAIQTTAVGIGTDSDGKTPEDVAADAAAAATATRNLAESAVTVADAVRILKKAAAEWRKNAPKKVDVERAEKRLSDAGTALADAQKAVDDASTASAKTKLDEAVAEQQAATRNLQKIRNDLKAADAAFDREWKKATAKLAALNKTGHDGDSPVTPAGTPAGTGTGSGSGTGTGAPAGTPAAKPGGTPAAAKPSGAPTGTTPPSSTATNTTTGKGADTETAALAAALAGQNQSQNQQPQQAAATTPQATPAATQPQQQGDKDKGDPNKALLDEAAQNSAAILNAAGITNPTTTVTGTPSPSPTPAPAANANGNGTVLRGPDAKITGVGLNGTPAVNTQNPVTSGRSFENLTTASDVGGRPQGTENKPFAPTPGGAETKTSSASGAGNTAQQQAAQQQAGQRGSGMPMMPMVPPTGGGAPASSAGRSSDGEPKPGVTSTSDPLGLMHERSHSVDGGTIAQSKPDRDQAPYAA